MSFHSRLPEGPPSTCNPELHPREFFTLRGRRTPYVPTPLAADNVKMPDGTTYETAVYAKCEALLGVQKPGANLPEGVVVNPSEHALQQPLWLRQFAHIALVGSASNRFRHHREALHTYETRQAELGNTLDPIAEEMLEGAKMGIASTEELMLLPSIIATLPAVEVAKLSHPFDWSATQEMDADVHGNIIRLGDVYGLRWLAGSGMVPDVCEPTYDIWCADNRKAPSALIMTRRERVAAIGNELLVSQRQALIIRLAREEGGDDPLDIPPELAESCHHLLIEGLQSDKKERRTHMKEPLTLVGKYIEQQLALDVADREEWLSPAVTAYYSRRLKDEERRVIAEAPQSLRGSLGSAALLQGPYTQSV